MYKNAVDKAVRAVGGQTAVARHFDIKQQSVEGWVKRGIVPGNRARKLARLSGVHESQLNPAVFGD